MFDVWKKLKTGKFSKRTKTNRLAERCIVALEMLTAAIKERQTELCYYFILLILMLFGPGNAASGQPAKQPPTPADFWQYDPNQRPDKKTSPPAIPAAITHHQLNINGQSLAYTATADTLPIRNATTGDTEGYIFYVYYTKDSGTSSRPLIFMFNGGPGSAAIWLHMLAFGPKRVDLLPDGTAPAPPNVYENNPYTLLDQADLVFIDPVGTGYSRPTEPAEGAKFWGMANDAASIGEFVRLFLERYQRWLSPKYVLGESYGTYRAAELSSYLVDRGIALNGMILISSLFEDDSRKGDFGSVNFMPTFILTAWYHKRLAPDLQKLSVTEMARMAEDFTSGEYMQALYRGTRMTPVERDKVVNDTVRFTGLSKPFVENNNLRISLPRFMTELLRDKKVVLGRLDSRVTSFAVDAGATEPTFDAAQADITNPVVSVFGDYISRELGYKTDSIYYAEEGGIGPWPGVRDAAPEIENAFARNPHMRLFVAEGYFDLATIYYGFDWSLSHLRISPDVARNITVRRYQSGHMIYTDMTALQQLRSDLRGWL